jgi:hypothetical protein
VDAYSYLPTFASLRERYGGGPDPHTPVQMREAMIAALRARTKSDGHLTLLFHPFSAAFTGDPGWEALDDVLSETVRLAGAGSVTTMRMDEAAAWMLERPAELSHPPQLDDATWMTP